MAPTTLIILLVASMCTIHQVTFAHQTASDCCLSTKDKAIPYKNVKCYIQQTTTQGCYINAIVFLTQKHKHLCAPTNSPWVKELMAKLDKNKPHLKKYCSR
ncbi:C-C motif chemokine 19 [Bufo gargarizans]|uniref:C-C motif chemokine 19 n=1 Tax=Bufo gargarizans TaxID=30331 RepID=UPI001CF53AE5|nr:C-C motif chemokine 19 [Bufo gargarizans]